MDTRKATALAAATILTLGAGSISAAVDLGLFRTAGAAAAGKAATLTKGPGSPEVVQVYKDVVDPPGTAGAVARPASAGRSMSPGQSRTAAGPSSSKSASPSSTAHSSSDDPAVSTTTGNGPECAEPPDEKDPEMESTTSTTGRGDDHPEADDNEEKDKAEKDKATSTTKATSSSVASPTVSTTVPTSTESCDDSNAPDPEDHPTMSSSISPTASTSPGHREDR
jgi:hypothetical protein